MTTNIYNMADTWNAIGTTFDAIKMNVSDGAGGAPVGSATSLFLNLQSNGTSVFTVSPTGRVLAGTASTAGFSGIGQTTALVFAGSAMQWYNSGPTRSMQMGSAAFSLGSTGSYNWSSTTDAAVTPDLSLFRDAANTLAQRNSTTAQKFNIYSTYTDASNYQRGIIDAGVRTANMFTLAADNLGTGPAMGLQFGVALTAGGGVTSIANFNTSGHFLWNTDNTYDIGASGATRPRNIYVAAISTSGTRFESGTTGSNGGLHVIGSSWLTASANGNWTMWNNGQTDFGILQFGGTTNVFPALARIGTGLQFQTADGATTGTWYKSTVLTLASLSASVISAVSAGSGGMAFVTDLTTASFVLNTTAAGGGSLAGPVFSDGTQWRAG